MSKSPDRNLRMDLGLPAKPSIPFWMANGDSFRGLSGSLGDMINRGHVSSFSESDSVSDRCRLF